MEEGCVAASMNQVVALFEHNNIYVVEAIDQEASRTKAEYGCVVAQQNTLILCNVNLFIFVFLAIDWFQEISVLNQTG